MRRKAAPTAPRVRCLCLPWPPRWNCAAPSRLEHSLDGVHWQTFAVENAGQGGTVRHGLSAQARFVRLQASSTAGGAGLCVLEWRLLARPSGPGGAGGSDSVGG